jgi:acyl-CoA synthetase (AMP-forming)/AMP-acid ligase II
MDYLHTTQAKWIIAGDKDRAVMRSIKNITEESWKPFRAKDTVMTDKKGIDIGAAELIEFVASKIARYKKPKHVLFVESLPKTTSGEINREEVKKTYSEKK